MNLLLFNAADKISGDEIRICDQRLDHLREVLKAKPGDTLRVGELNGLMGQGELLALNTESATLRIDLTAPPPPKVPIILVVALPRPKMLRRILRNAAEFGVAELHLINSYRVEKSFWQTPVLNAQQIERYLLQGLEQARDTVLPTVHLHRRFKVFAEDVCPGLCVGKKALLAHPGDHPPCPQRNGANVLLVIGPEGGFIPYEVEKLQSAGCEAVSLGARILRVENAVTSLLGKLI